MKERHEMWGTQDEIRFIGTIGTGMHPACGKLVGKAQIDLLRKYRDAIPLRDEWDAIDKEIIIGVVENKLEHLEAVT